MLAWAHFTLTELRPLYALFYVSYLLAQRMAMDGFVLGSNDPNECWLSVSYLKCAASCSSYFLFRTCECPGTFYYCEWFDEEDQHNRTLRDRPGIPSFVSDDGGWIVSRLTYPEVVPSNWTCHPALYGTNNGWCACRCGVWDPGCDDNTIPVLFCNEGATCEKTSDGYGVCSDEDYEEDYHWGVEEEYADGFPPYQWLGRYAHSAKDVFEWHVSISHYPPGFWDWNPYEGVQSMDVALGEKFFWPAWGFWICSALLASFLTLATGLFLRRAGPSAALDGAYVRFCLRLEHGKRFRRCVIGGCVFVCLMGVGIVIIYQTLPNGGTLPSHEYLIELLFAFFSLRAMLLTDSDFALDVDDPAFDDVQFRFFPLLWHGCDEAIHDLTSAVARRGIDEGEYRRKLRKYVRSGGESLRLVRAPSDAAPAGDEDETRLSVGERSEKG
jgi:hypothetical protein